MNNILQLATLKITFDSKGTIEEQQKLLNATLQELREDEKRKIQSGLLHSYNNGDADIYLVEADHLLCSLPEKSLLGYPKLELYQLEQKIELPEISLLYEIKNPSYQIFTRQSKSGSLDKKLKLNEHLKIEDITIAIHGNMQYWWTDNLETQFNLANLKDALFKM